MGKVLKDSQGKVLLTGGNAIEVTSSIDSNILAGNIKKDVTILGVTGTYEGSGGNISPEVVTVTFKNYAAAVAYYVDSVGAINTISISPDGGTAPCLAGSMITIFYLLATEPGTTDNISNCTLINSISLGSRANYNHAVIYQVNSTT